MYATVRRYEHVDTSITTDELAQAGRDIAAGLSHTPGFVSFLIIDSSPEPRGLSVEQNRALAIVSIFEDRGRLEQADDLIAAPLDTRLAAKCPGQVQVTTGEIVFQRGL